MLDPMYIHIRTTGTTEVVSSQPTAPHGRQQSPVSCLYTPKFTSQCVYIYITPKSPKLRFFFLFAYDAIFVLSSVIFFPVSSTYYVYVGVVSSHLLDICLLRRVLFFL